MTPVYFSGIYDDFKESGVEAAEFVRDYENKYSTCIQEFSADGDTIKFELCDDALGCLGMYESYDVPNVLEILNSLALEHYDKWVKWGQSNEAFARVAKEYEELGNEYEELGKRLSDICLVLDNDNSACKAD